MLTFLVNIIKRLTYLKTCIADSGKLISFRIKSMNDWEMKNNTKLLIPDTGIELQMTSGCAEDIRFSSKLLSWSFYALLQHLLYIFTWIEVISYIKVFLEQEKMLQMPSG